MTDHIPTDEELEVGFATIPSIELARRKTLSQNGLWCSARRPPEHNSWHRLRVSPGFVV